MKGLKLSLMVLTATMLAVGMSGMAYAFHSGGVADCSGCHSMHSPNQGGSFLLKASDSSSACLNCHQVTGLVAPEGYHVSTAETNLVAGQGPFQRNPAGDFAWLKKTYTWIDRDGVNQAEEGATHGHNIKAFDYNYAEDPRTSPGGSYSGSNLGCSSCHDPHGGGRRMTGGFGTNGAPIVGSGSYNNVVDPIPANQAVGLYRLLGYPGYSKVNFGAWPIALAPRSIYNRSETTAALQVRVAYANNGLDTWGAWCGTCHGAMHNGAGKRHPVDVQLGTTIADNYNKYVSSGVMTGAQATAFSSLVPFAKKNATFGTLKTLADNTSTNLNGPTDTDEVTCFSCHRPHASGWKNALRWDSEETMITNSTPAYTLSNGRLVGDVTAAYYDRPATMFGAFQRNLCNKCHAKD